MASADFYAAYADEQVLTNLFNGWGYNFYRAENQLRADDLMVRAYVGEMLCAAKASVQDIESAFRRTHLPPPSRAHPLPDPEAVRLARELEEVARAIGAIEGQIRALPVPEADRMTQRLRDERETLQQLLHVDRTMVAVAGRLRSALGAVAADKAADVVGISTPLLLALGTTVQDRRDLLHAPT